MDVLSNDIMEAYSQVRAELLRLRFYGWPREIAVECTTHCNARCKHCTHDELIRSGARQSKSADKYEIFYRVVKARMLCLLTRCPDACIEPVGLGEPLLHKDICEIIEFMCGLFEKVNLNTNCSMLSDEMSRKLIELPLNCITLSLSYENRNVFEREVGLDYQSVRENVKHYLMLRKQKQNVASIVIVHIFDNNYNSDSDNEMFRREMRPFLMDGDRIQLRPYYEFNGEALTNKQHRMDVAPCESLWQVLMIDVDGWAFPCCMGGWKPFDEKLSIGSIRDGVDAIVRNLMKLREDQINGNMGNCPSCFVLKMNGAFVKRRSVYNIERSVRGPITLLSDSHL